MNGLLSNEEAECGLNPNSEDLDAEEDDGLTVAIVWEWKRTSCLSGINENTIIFDLAL